MEEGLSLFKYFDDKKERILAELKDFYGEDLDEYKKGYLFELSWVKTFINGHDPIHISEAYFPLTLKRRLKNTKSFRVEKYSDLIKHDNFLMICGDAGSGKTTLIKFLLYDILRSGYSVPIFMPLRNINWNKPDESISSYLVNNGVCQDNVIAHRDIKRGDFVFFFDGFDEVKSVHKEVAINFLREYSKSYKKNKYIVTSRPNTGVQYINFYRVYDIQPLTCDDVKQFIDKSFENERATLILDSLHLDQKIEHEKSNGYQVDKEILNSGIWHYIGNILLLSIYGITYESNSEAPETLVDFYEKIINTLFIEHDTRTKPDLKRELKSGLTRKQIKKIIGAFSFKSYFSENYQFKKDYIEELLENITKNSDPKLNIDAFINDIEESICIWTNDSGRYSFIHRSIQEYFCALAVQKFDDATKKEFFDNLHRIYYHSKRTEMTNFLRIYNELDEYTFSMYFLIPYYNERIKELRDDFDSVVSYLIKATVKSITINLKTSVENDMRKSHDSDKYDEDYISENDENLTKLIDKTVKDITKSRSQDKISWTKRQFFTEDIQKLAEENNRQYEKMLLDNKTTQIIGYEAEHAHTKNLYGFIGDFQVHDLISNYAIEMLSEYDIDELQDMLDLSVKNEIGEFKVKVPAKSLVKVQQRQSSEKFECVINQMIEKYEHEVNRLNNKLSNMRDEFSEFINSINIGVKI